MCFYFPFIIKLLIKFQRLHRYELSLLFFWNPEFSRDRIWWDLDFVVYSQILASEQHATQLTSGKEGSVLFQTQFQEASQVDLAHEYNTRHGKQKKKLRVKFIFQSLPWTVWTSLSEFVITIRRRKLCYGAQSTLCSLSSLIYLLLQLRCRCEEFNLLIYNVNKIKPSYFILIISQPHYIIF